VRTGQAAVIVAGAAAEEAATGAAVAMVAAGGILGVEAIAIRAVTAAEQADHPS
jgi:hypothetical protein